MKELQSGGYIIIHAAPQCQRCGQLLPNGITGIAQHQCAANIHPCQLGQHRWAYLTAGGQACGYCGTRRDTNDH